MCVALILRYNTPTGSDFKKMTQTRFCHFGISLRAISSDHRLIGIAY